VSRVEFVWVSPYALVLPSPASCRFVGPAEVVQMALAAFYASSRDQEPPEGEVWAYTGDDLPSGTVSYWSGPEDFAVNLLRHMESRLRAAALATGFATERAWTDEETDEHDASLASFEAMAHGCAALDLGAGAPPTISPDASLPSAANPLFLEPCRQELPVRESVSDAQPNRSFIA